MPRGARRYLSVLVLLILAGLACAWYVLAPKPGGSAAGTSGSVAPSPSRRLALLENSLRAVAEGERAAPRDRWDPQYVVDAVGGDPQQLADWVRDQTRWIPYHGVLRSAVGVLMDREGNGLDRAILLGTLLTKAGHTVRLARGQLPRELAAGLLPDLVSRHTMARAAPLDLEREQDVSSVAAAYDLDGEAIQRTRSAQERLVGELFQELEKRVADQTARLQAAVSPPDPQPEWEERYAGALDALRDYWWVQVMEGSAWRDLDLVHQDSTEAAPLVPSETVDLDDIPPARFHELTVRVVVEHSGRSGLEEHAVLEHALRPADLFGQPIVLQIWPGAMPKEIHADPQSPHGLRAAALAQGSWAAVLAVGDQPVAHGLLAPEYARPKAAEGNPLGGLGLGIREAVRSSEQAADSAPSHELSAAWIEYEISAAEQSPRKYRRAVFDLIGPDGRAGGGTSQLNLDERQRLTRSLALMLRTEILPLPCRLAPEFIAHLSARSLLANRRGLLEVVANWATPSALESDTLLASAAPALSTRW